MSISVKAKWDGAEHTAIYDLMPDYLAIGSDADFVRMPMNPHTAQAFCDAAGMALPTRKMCNDIWAQAAVRLIPQPLTKDRESPATFLQSQRLIEEQAVGIERCAIWAGIKKDVVISNRLQERPNRVAIFGWHYPSGAPIQPLSIVHVDWYVDYRPWGPPGAAERPRGRPRNGLCRRAPRCEVERPAQRRGTDRRAALLITPSGQRITGLVGDLPQRSRTARQLTSQALQTPISRLYPAR